MNFSNCVLLYSCLGSWHQAAKAPGFGMRYPALVGGCTKALSLPSLWLVQGSLSEPCSRTSSGSWNPTAGSLRFKEAVYGEGHSQDFWIFQSYTVALFESWWQSIFREHMIPVPKAQASGDGGGFCMDEIYLCVPTAILIYWFSC